MPQKSNILPGFGLTFGVTLLSISCIILIPLGGLFVTAAGLTLREVIQKIMDPRVLAAFQLSFTSALLAALVNCFFGLIVAWVMVRYEFYGRKYLDALIDLPFALPTAVAGIILTAVYSPNGALGKMLTALGLQVAFTPLGVIVALIFTGLPFVIRSVQPVLEDFDREVEDAAKSLGATRWQTFWRTIFPETIPALLSGFSLALARGLGEYGSVIFISGNMPLKTEIVPLLIIIKLEQFDQKGAAIIALVMLAMSFILLATINIFAHRWNRKYENIKVSRKESHSRT